MAAHGSSGVWELFVPGLSGGELYKYEIRNRASGEVVVKTDPYAQQFERRPGTAARCWRRRATNGMTPRGLSAAGSGTGNTRR